MAIGDIIRLCSTKDFTVPGWIVAFFLLLILVMPFVSSFITYNVTLKADVDNLREDLTKTTDLGDDSEERLDQHDISISLLSEKLDSINQNLKEIKSDIKDIKNKG